MIRVSVKLSLIWRLLECHVEGQAGYLKGVWKV